MSMTVNCKHVFISISEQIDVYWTSKETIHGGVPLGLSFYPCVTGNIWHTDNYDFFFLRFDNLCHAFVLFVKLCIVRLNNVNAHCL